MFYFLNKSYSLKYFQNLVKQSFQANTIINVINHHLLHFKTHKLLTKKIEFLTEIKTSCDECEQYSHPSNNILSSAHKS